MPDEPDTEDAADHDIGLQDQSPDETIPAEEGENKAPISDEEPSGWHEDPEQRSAKGPPPWQN